MLENSLNKTTSHSDLTHLSINFLHLRVQIEMRKTFKDVEAKREYTKDNTQIEDVCALCFLLGGSVVNRSLICGCSLSLHFLADIYKAQQLIQGTSNN